VDRYLAPETSYRGGWAALTFILGSGALQCPRPDLTSDGRVGEEALDRIRDAAGAEAQPVVEGCGRPGFDLNSLLSTGIDLYDGMKSS